MLQTVNIFKTFYKLSNCLPVNIHCPPAKSEVPFIHPNDYSEIIIHFFPKKWKKRSDVTDSIRSSCLEAWLAFAERKYNKKIVGFFWRGWKKENKVFDFTWFFKTFAL